MWTALRQGPRSKKLRPPANSSWETEALRQTIHKELDPAACCVREPGSVPGWSWDAFVPADRLQTEPESGAPARLWLDPRCSETETGGKCSFEPLALGEGLVRSLRGLLRTQSTVTQKWRNWEAKLEEQGKANQRLETEEAHPTPRQTPGWRERDGGDASRAQRWLDRSELVQLIRSWNQEKQH